MIYSAADRTTARQPGKCKYNCLPIINIMLSRTFDWQAALEKILFRRNLPCPSAGGKTKKEGTQPGASTICFS